MDGMSIANCLSGDESKQRGKEDPVSIPPRLEVAADLRLVDGLDTFLDRKDAVLLSQVRLNRSLQCAASITGMGYRQAIERVRGLNALAGRPLVESQQGGCSGGSTRLTPFGESLLELYGQASREHQGWIGELNRKLKADLAWTVG
jgi:molybdate transport repressor ModE-like protein